MLAARLEKHQEEVTALESAIRTKDKIIAELKPVVIEYNENMKGRKVLRKQLAAKQRETKVLVEFFTGTTIFDERFPLFATEKTETTDLQH